MRERVEATRGCALLHTRATHPEFDDRVYSNTSWAGRFYALARQRVLNNISGVPLVPFGRRTPEEEAAFSEWASTHDLSMDTAMRFRPEGQTVTLFVAGQGCVSNGGGHFHVWRQSNECSNHLHTMWTISRQKFAVGPHSGRLIMVGDRRDAKCIAAYADGRKQGGLSVGLHACVNPNETQWRGRASAGLVWHAHGGDLRSAVSGRGAPPWSACLVYTPTGFDMMRCGDNTVGSATKWLVKNVTSSQYDKAVEHATELQFPAALRRPPYNVETTEQQAQPAT